MKRSINKKHVILGASTIILVGLSTLLLSSGISFAAKVGVGKIENISTEKLVSKPSDSQSQNNDKILKEQLLDSIKKIKAEEKVEKIDSKEQEELYESVKNKINIQREEAKEIVKNKIFNVFGDSLNTSDMKIYFWDEGVSHPISYRWAANVLYQKNKKLYACIISAMSGECNEILKSDYTGLEDPSDGDLITRITTKLSKDKINQYISKAKEIVNENTILNAKNSVVGKFSLTDSCYLGLRPTVQVSAKTKNSQVVDVVFYTDTDELYLVNLYYE